MLLFFFAEQGATAPNGNQGGVSIRQANPPSAGWTATSYFGGTTLGSITLTNIRDAWQRATILWEGAWINITQPDQDPDN